MGATTHTKVLIVEDDLLTKVFLARALAVGGEEFETRWASSAEEAGELLRRELFSFVLSDLILAGNGTGMDVMRECKRVAPGTRFVLMTAYPGARPEADLPFLLKPFTPQEVLSRLK